MSIFAVFLFKNDEKESKAKPKGGEAFHHIHNLLVRARAVSSKSIIY